MLLAVENGEVNKWREKQLSDISINGNAPRIIFCLNWYACFIILLIGTASEQFSLFANKVSIRVFLSHAARRGILASQCPGVYFVSGP